MDIVLYIVSASQMWPKKHKVWTNRRGDPSTCQDPPFGLSFLADEQYFGPAEIWAMSLMNKLYYLVDI